MAGSIAHVTDEYGDFTMEYIENLGDAEEALKDFFEVNAHLKKEIERAEVRLAKAERELSDIRRHLPIEMTRRRAMERVVAAARRAKREAHGGHYAGCEAVSILTEALDAYDREEE